MGMFDNVLVEYPLPGPKIELPVNDPLGDDGRFFQTKDFDRALDTYIITKEGKLLIKQTVFLETVTAEEVTEKIFTGSFKFYSCTTSHEWVEFKATFKNGILKKIKRMYAIDKLEEELEEAKRSLKQKQKGDSDPWKWKSY